MADHVTDDADVERLVEEISRLRGQVAQLQERVEQLDHLAHQDSLIDLPNRRGFLRELQRLIARVGRYDAKGAMLFVDVDGLKAINDSFGHRAGDEALIEVAELLESGVRKSDVVARIGGDEFGILLENADELVRWARRSLEAAGAAEKTTKRRPALTARAGSTSGRAAAGGPARRSAQSKAQDTRRKPIARKK